MHRAPPASLAQSFKDRGVRDIECIFPDVSGYPRGKLMPSGSFAAGGELRIAQAIPMQAVTGEYSYDLIFPDEDPDILLVPDYGTVKPVPWATTPRDMAIHDCHELSGELCQFAPRSILKQVLARYDAMGLIPVVAPEIEFYLTAANVNPDDALKPPMGRGGRAEVGQSAFGIRGDTWIHEVGLTQYEINLLHGNAVEMADQAFLFKYAAKEIALKHRLNAVFMAKPIAGEAGSSMHLHQSIVDAGGNNIFSNADGSESESFHYFIGGLQAYLPDLMLVFAPFVNSYRRFIKGSMAPVNLLWGHDNRTTGLRIPRSDPAARRVETRVAGADANPYLILAATLAAGLAGIEEKLTPTQALEGSAYDHSHDLARTFLAAHEQFEASASARRLLGDHFVTAYASVKDIEYQNYLSEIGAWERRFLLPQV